MNLNRITKQWIAFVFGISAFLFLYGLIGHYDYIDEVMINMPQEAYDAIVLKLGDDVSKEAIVNEYQANKELYDKLSW